MKFFVPLVDSEADAELIWAGARADLFDVGFPTTGRRVRALLLYSEDRNHLLKVGGRTPDGELVMMILEATDLDLFYVCTPDRGAIHGLPYPLGLAPPSCAIDFDEELVGWA